MNGEPPESAGPEQAGDPPRRDGAGRFRKGASGNPAGRPPGRRGHVAALLDQLATDAAPQAVERLGRAAMGGDVQAARVLLDRVWPVPKGRRVVLDLPRIATPGDAAEAAQRIVAEAAAGAIAPDEAAALLALVTGAAQVGALADLERRLGDLERRAGLSQP